MAVLKTSLFSEEIVISAGKYSKDKVIHADLKEIEYDDIVLSAIHPESTKLIDSVKRNSEVLTQKTEYQITETAEVVMADQLLRVSFWDEVNKAVVEGRTITERNIFNGVCSNKYWMRVRDELDDKMAYILCPLMAYTKANKLGLQLGQRAMLDILNVSPKGENGKFDTKLAQLQFSVFKELQDRSFGKAVQRIQSHNTNETVTNDSIEDLHKEIAMLEGKPISDGDIPTTIEMSE